MNKPIVTFLSLAVCAALAGCTEQAATPSTPIQTSVTEQAVVPVVQTNTLLKEFSGPYNGVPAFDKMQLADIKPAFDYAMAANLAEIDAITANPAAPDFDNTIAALERAGSDLNQVFT